MTRKHLWIAIMVGLLTAILHFILGHYVVIDTTSTSPVYAIPQATRNLPGTGSALLLGFVLTFLYLRSKQIYSKIFLGMIGGAIFGYLFGHIPTTVIAPIGDIFIRLIKMVVVPLVFASLSLGVLSIGNIKKIGRIGGKTICYYLVTTSMAISIGLIIANLVKPGSFISTQDKVRYIKQYESEARSNTSGSPQKNLALTMGKVLADSYNFASQKEKRKFLDSYQEKVDEYMEDISPKKVKMKDTLVQIVPTNPINSMVRGDMLQIIFFALLFGLALATVAKKKKEVIEKALSGLNDAMVTLVTWIMLFAPFGVFALMANTIARAGTSILSALIVYMLVVIAGLVLHIFVVYSTSVRIFGKIGIFQFIGKARSVLLLAFSTSSSAAALPVTMRCAEEQFGVSPGVSSFVLPLGATINMDGTALYQGVAAVFIAQVYGIPLDLIGQLTILLTATLASIGTAAVPGAGMIILAMVLEAVNVPVIGIALIIGVDRLLDMCRTAVNVTGDLSAAIFIHATENQQLPE